MKKHWLALATMTVVTVGGVFIPATAGAALCPNEAFRSGSSASLPDCRAYELVTPPDTNGRLVGAINTFGTPPVSGEFPTEHAAPSRDSVVYMSYSSPLLGVGEPNGNTDAYEAERAAAGWVTDRHLSLPGPGAVLPIPGGVSPDHLYATANAGGFTSPLSLGGDTDYLLNPDGSQELVGLGGLGSEPFAQTRWISEGGEHVIFSTGSDLNQSVWCFRAKVVCKVTQLQPDAPPTGTSAIYDRAADGPTHVVSLLPGDVTPTAGEEAFYKGASRDGAAVAFTIEGTLYVRVDNEETLEVLAGEPSFAGLSDDGRYLFYVAGENIHRFDTETEEDDQVNATGDGEVMNVSADGSHVYFISKSQIGGKGTAGEPNVYVWSGGTPGYITTVIPSDLENTSGLSSVPALTRWTSHVMPKAEGDWGPGASSTRTTRDGTVLAFESRAQLTAYDNDGHTEIYRYDDGDKSLICVSCNPKVEPAIGDARLQQLTLTSLGTVIHNLSDDGSRVFFESDEALVTEDVDSVNDIYEWQREEGGEAQVDLISSGKSVGYPTPEGGGDLPFLPKPNILLAVTPDGKDVIFLSQEALVPGAGEGGTQAIYDARVNGGFPLPVPKPICTEEGCRPASGATLLPPGPPQSEATRGSGNVTPRKRRPRCRRPKHKHCAKKQKAGQRSARASSSTSPSSPTYAPEFSSTAGKNTNLVEVAQPASFPVTAAGPFDEFGIEKVSAGLSTTAAAMHPDFVTDITINHFINEKNNLPEANARTEEIAISLPPGLLGNANAIPKCSMGLFLAFGNCPLDSQVGVARVTATLLGPKPITLPLFNLEPPHPEEEIARFGLIAHSYPTFIDVTVRTAGDYGATATVHSAPGLTALLGSKTTIWGNPADPIHDKQRMNALEAAECEGPCPPEGNPSTLPPTAFMINPSACQPMPLAMTAKSYQRPGEVFTASTEMDPITDCQGLPFSPSFQAQLTTPTAGAPSGLHTTLTIPQQSTEAVDSPSTATMREARVTLPPGFQVNAGAADGISACNEAQIGYHSEVDESCPDASKIGVATIQSPLLPHPIGAEIFLRNQRPGHPFGLWLASDELGLHVKIPGELEPDKATGQLTAVFTDLPQTPVSQIELNVWGGPRAPLAAPEACGTYQATWSFKPHSDDPPVIGSSPITVDQGCGNRPFSPVLHAGTTHPVAGAYSPFEFDLQREDSEENLAALDLTLPDGLLAKLAGVPLCPDAVVESGNCPAGSKIGTLVAQTGSGPFPLWIPQPSRSQPAVYLAGPYRSAPYSIVAVVPAQAGPFDLGNVVVRSALQVDPETARATVASDPLPRFFEGVGVIYRRIHVVVDRPEFTLNPTDCSDMAITSRLTSTRGAVATPQARFQVDGCRALKYTPRLKLAFKGSTRRSGHPALKAVLTQPPHQANTAKATVVLPATEFIDQDHINNPCTRVQFREDRCPKLSILGRVTAVTPLLDKPLKGNVYFRSNGGERELPDIVADLRGQIHATIVGFIDSVPVKGTELSQLRTRFTSVPDAPVTKFKIDLFGGAKNGLLENSRNLCATKRRAKVSFLAQNGRRSNRNLLIKTNCGKH